jgi:hypothetical protein
MEVFMSKQFDELNSLLDLVDHVSLKLAEDLADDGKISIGEWVGLAFSTAPELISNVTKITDVTADKMSTDEMLVLLKKLVSVGSDIAAIFAKKP